MKNKETDDEIICKMFDIINKECLDDKKKFFLFLPFKRNKEYKKGTFKSISVLSLNTKRVEKLLKQNIKGIE